MARRNREVPGGGTTGPLAPFADDYKMKLRARGYSARSVTSELRQVARLSRWLTMREWRSLGVTPIGRSLPDNELASLIEPDGPYETAYLLTTNYRVILDYNCSNFYAISVGVLADQIAQR